MTGAIVSTTLTENEHVFVFPFPSPALHTTGVVPRGKLLFDGGRQTAARAPAQLSKAATVNATVVPVGSLHSATMFEEQNIAGGVRSSTVTVKPQFGPPGSLARWQLTLVLPKAKRVPEDGEQSTGRTLEREPRLRFRRSWKQRRSASSFRIL